MTLPANDEGAVRAAPNLDDLQEFSDFIIAGLPLVQARDENAWALGDIARLFVERVVHGRPPDEDETPTLSDLAREWDVHKQKVSYWRANAAFFPENVRQSDVSFAHHDLARRHSDASLDNALELLAVARDLHYGIAAFRRWLAGEYFAGPVDTATLPGLVRACIPSGKRRVRVVVTDLSDEGDE